MPNKVYSNFYLSNEIEDQYNSHLDLQRFCNVDNSLVGTVGMKRKINVYKATNGTEKLAVTKGNTQKIEVTFSEKEYEILLAQNRFVYYDEQAMQDDMLVPVGAKHMATDMFNTINADIFAEFNKATLQVTAKKLDFAAFVDAMALLNVEDVEKQGLFAFVNPADMAELRKNLADSLKFVEGFERKGYVGTVAGVNIYTKKDAVAKTIIVANRDAVTLFNKKGVEVEQERNKNTRENVIYSRKYYLAALTDTTKAVKIVVNQGA